MRRRTSEVIGIDGSLLNVLLGILDCLTCSKQGRSDGGVGGGILVYIPPKKVSLP